MSTAENNCIWHFGSENGRSEGPFDATGQNFRQRPYASLLRESVQNSMDAHAKYINTDGSVSIPTVEVTFSFGSLVAKDYPEFYKLRDHIKCCYDSYPQNEDYKIFYNGMLENFDNRYRDEIPYLKISDRKTTGMGYVRNDLSNPFQAFVRSSQISVKGDCSGAAGSHGYGKAAYYLLSPVRTLLVSTMTEDGTCYFEGASIIGSHIKNDTLLCAAGYYDNNNGQPIQHNTSSDNPSNCSIPKEFRRKEPGTDFYIMGFLPENIDEMCEEMIRESLRSYWLAIFKDRISITLKKPQSSIDIVINKARLPLLMNSYFPESKDESKQLRTMNPRPYYDAYTKQETGDKAYVKFTDTFQTIGEVSMYIKKCKTKFDKIAHMRKPLMLVYGLPKDDDNGFYGLFLCENDKGDKILKRLENSSHTEWKASNFRDARNKIYPEGELALKEIELFTSDCIKKMFGNKEGKSLDIAGLSEFLYVPDTLIEEDDIENIIDQPIDRENNDGSSIKTNLTEEKMIPNTTKPNHYGSVIIEQEGKISHTEKGDILATTGHGYGSSEAGNNIPNGEIPSKVKISSSNGTHWSELEVPIRVFCQETDGYYYHFVKIHSDKAFNKAKLIMTVGMEEDDEKIIPIMYTSVGNARGHIIENFSLEKGTTTIKVLFADNLPHSVIKKLYYEEI